MARRVGHIADEGETHRIDVEPTDRPGNDSRGLADVEPIDAAVCGDDESILTRVEGKPVNVCERRRSDLLR